eukprot:2550884-Prymnesium_polylepis.1
MACATTRRAPHAHASRCCFGVHRSVPDSCVVRRPPRQCAYALPSRVARCERFLCVCAEPVTDAARSSCIVALTACLGDVGRWQA